MSDRAPEETTLVERLDGLRCRLRRMVELRMHPRLKGRIDASDVIQDAFIDVLARLPEYRSVPELSFYCWVRRITADKLFDLHRHHLGAQKRDARREGLGAVPEVSTLSLSKVLVDAGPTPSEAGGRIEEIELVRRALDQMEPGEREALTLRHFEEATNAEVACVLGVSEATASRHYMSALERVRAILERHVS